jgi:lipoprotein NlpI
MIPAGVSAQETSVECFERGNAKFDAHDYSGAIADYDKALELDSGNDLARSSREIALGLANKGYPGAGPAKHNQH